ncbi:MAG: NAD(P)-binding domain-containing protein [Gemmatimonadota bacterium]|jgi:predicted dinucleotide-binding enzyme
MDIGILGSGVVGQTLGAALARMGHDVTIGTRSPENLGGKRGLGETSLAEWLERSEGNGSVGSFEEAATHGEVVINATAGAGSLDALRMAGGANLAGKILIDASNPLDFSQGMPPTLTVCNETSLGEQIQAGFPEVRVVKALNTVTAALMVDPAAVGGGEHHLPVCGDDADAKRRVSGWLRDWFGWEHVIDLGPISSARGTEMYLPLWLRLWGALDTAMFNFRIVT